MLKPSKTAVFASSLRYFVSCAQVFQFFSVVLAFLRNRLYKAKIPHKSTGFLPASFLSMHVGAGYGSRTRLTCLGSTGTTDVLTLQIKGLEPIITDAGEKIKSFLNEIEKMLIYY